MKRLIVMCLLLSFSLPLLIITQIVEPAYAQSQTKQERRKEAIRLHKLGIEQFKNNQLQEALKIFQRLLVITKEIRALLEESIVLTNMGDVHIKLEQYTKALEVYKQALDIQRKLGDKEGEEISFNKMSLVYKKLGQHEKAQEFSKKASNARKELSLQSEAQKLQRQGIELHDKGKLLAALQFYQKALSIYIKIKDANGEAKILYEIGLTSFALKDYQRAIDNYEKALLTADFFDDFEHQALIYNSLGPVYIELGNPKKAIENYEKGLNIVQKNIAESYKIKGVLLGNMANAYNVLGDSKKAVYYYEQRLNLARQTQDWQGEASAYSNLGKMYYNLGNYPKAIDYAQRSFTIFQKQNFQSGEINTLRNLGIYLLKANQIDEAEKVIRTVISKMENQLELLGDNDFYRVAYFNDLARIYRLLESILVKANKYNEALEVSEQGRARVFAKLLTKENLRAVTATNPTIAPPSIEKVKQIAKQQNATLVQYTVIEDESDLNRESKLFIWVIKPTGEVIFKQVDLQPLWECKEKVCPESLADYIVDIRKSIGAGDFRGLQLNYNPSSKTIIQQKEGLQKLHKILIQPIANLLPKDPNQHVIFVPHQSLFLIPFPSLQDNNGKYLIEKHTIITAPAIQVLPFTHERQQLSKQTNNYNDILVIGNPTMPTVFTATEDTLELSRNVEKLRYILQQMLDKDPDNNASIDIEIGGSNVKAIQLPSLPGAEREAKAVAQLFNTNPLIGNQATKTVVVEKMLKSRIVHFATHGLLGTVTTDDNSSAPIGAIALAPSVDNKESLLTSLEIINMKLNAELVVLSACNTGQGRITSDGILGLSRSLISAGVPSIVVSLWAVDDKSTEFLMTEFYTNLRKNPDKAAALRTAMLTTMKKYPRPVDWATKMHIFKSPRTISY